MTFYFSLFNCISLFGQVMMYMYHGDSDEFVFVVLFRICIERVKSIPIPVKSGEEV